MKALRTIAQYNDEKKISYLMIGLGLSLIVLFASYLFIMIAVTHTGYAITTTSKAETEYLETISELENRLSTTRRAIVFESRDARINSFESIAGSVRYQSVNTETYSLAR